MYVPAILATWGIVVTGVYLLRTMKEAFLGKMPARWEGLEDAQSPFQKMPFVLLATTLLVFGFWPKPLLWLVRAGGRSDRQGARRGEGPRDAARGGRGAPAPGDGGRQVNLDLHFLLPEVVVVATALACVTVDILVAPARRIRLVPATAALGLAAALLVLLARPPRRAPPSAATSRSTRSRCSRARSPPRAGSCSSRSPVRTRRRMDRGHGEFYGLLLLALTGVMLTAGVADLMSLFVSLELVTITSYVARRVQAPRPALDGGGAQVPRRRRRLVGLPPLRHRPRLRGRRGRRLPLDRRARRGEGPGGPARRSAPCSSSWGSSSRRPPCPSRSGRRTSTRARRRP